MAPWAALLLQGACRPGHRASLQSARFLSRLTPPAPSWGVHDLARPQPSCDELSDEQIVHLAKLSHLSFQPGTAEFARVKRDVSRLVSVVKNFQHDLAALKLSPEAEAALQRAAEVVDDDAVAEQRLAELRPDRAEPPLVGAGGAHDGGVRSSGGGEDDLRDELLGHPEEVLKHAAVRHGQYFLVPRVIDE